MIEPETILHTEFPSHPFSSIPNQSDYRTLLSNYLAMSQAFPYLQAGSQGDIFFRFMENNQDIPEQVELTTIVGNFLSWDETGGLNLTLASGLKALPRLLETKRFHANMLKQDCITLLGSPVAPDYSSVTRSYLRSLYNGLASECPITRVAMMVSFEAHAHNMIDALWDSLADRFSVPKNKLSYFAVHVGGEDPAEPYHVEMTQLLIEKMVPEHEESTFREKLIDSYRLHAQWCTDVVALSCAGSSVAA